MDGEHGLGELGAGATESPGLGRCGAWDERSAIRDMACPFGPQITVGHFCIVRKLFVLFFEWSSTPPQALKRVSVCSQTTWFICWFPRASFGNHPKREYTGCYATL